MKKLAGITLAATLCLAGSSPSQAGLVEEGFGCAPQGTKTICSGTLREFRESRNPTDFVTFFRGPGSREFLAQVNGVSHYCQVAGWASEDLRWLFDMAINHDGYFSVTIDGALCTVIALNNSSSRPGL